MSNPSDLPLALHKANMEFVLRTAGLMQDSVRQWFDLGAKVVDARCAESKSCAERLTRIHDWPSFATLSGESARGVFQQRLGDGQAAAQVAIASQAAFASGLQDAFQAWQKDTAQAFGGNGEVAPFNTAFGDFLRQAGMLPADAADGAKKGAARAK
ncbi:hypothetical protein GCM10023144_41660 [Pigmentiphaga soli]|uniref:Phasin domain-containing protein n=1 Tax=Pigmentiphaga soli TaxID=1007095 RepID=A0ABP8HM75_9BURK